MKLLICGIPYGYVITDIKQEIHRFPRRLQSWGILATLCAWLEGGFKAAAFLISVGSTKPTASVSVAQSKHDKRID